MKKSNTSKRLKQIMMERKLKQVDILRKAEPYCTLYSVKLGKNDLSQYVSGKTEPGQDKLFILASALNVNEAWLMGYDVSIDRDITSDDIKTFPSSVIEGRNVIKIAGRDGSYEERILTDEQLNALMAIINQMPDISDL